MKNIITIVCLACAGLAGAFANSYTLPVPIGDIHRAYIKYANTTTITVTAGYGECNGFYWENTSDTNVSLTVPTAEDIVYIYVDFSESDFPSVVFTDSTTEPTFSDAKLGWYNGDDRCIGAVYSPASSATINNFNYIGTKLIFTGSLYLEQSANPSATWQNTNVSAADVSPVIADSLALDFKINDSSSSTATRLTVRSAGNTAHVVGGSNVGNQAHNGQWLHVGRTSRVVQHLSVGDNGTMDIRLRGWDIDR